MEIIIPIRELSELSPRLVTLCDGRAGLRRALHLEVRQPNRQVLECASPLALSHGQDLRPGDEQPRNPKRQGTGALQNAGALSDPQAPSPDTQHSSPVLDFIASDETLDRYDEIIVASGWRLENYRRNPVFQNAHQYGDVIFTLGRALITGVRPGRLFQRIEFATEVNPMARIAYGLYKGGFLNAVSVGFIPLRWENGDGTERGHSCPQQLRNGAGERVRCPVGATHIAAAWKGRAPLSKTGFRRRYLEQELL